LIPGEWMLAVITGYFDDTQSDQRLCTVAGLAGYPNQWELFERLWGAVLAAHGIPYFHMREMAATGGVFARWHPPETHQEDVSAFLRDAIAAIRDPYLHMFASIVHIRDLERFNADKGLDLKPYSLAVSACLTQLALHYPHLPVTAVFDRVEGIDDKLAVARSYAEGYVTPDPMGRIASVPLTAGSTSRTVLPLQAADLVAWEQRRVHAPVDAAHRAPEHAGGKTRDEQWEEYRVWSRLNRGREYPLQRKSLEVLIDAGLSVNLVVWDYRHLSATHDLRNGIWAPAR
jgi:hypothetical protein